MRHRSGAGSRFLRPIGEPRKALGYKGYQRSVNSASTASRITGNSGARVKPQDRAMQPLDRLLTVEDLADYLGVPVATMYAWRYRHQGPPGFRVGRHLRYRRSDVDEWIDHQLREPML